MLTPQIMPRIRALAGSGFGYFAFLIASVYQMVRILPVGHVYTRPGNIGTFGIRDVVLEAANNVKLEWRNIDQIIIFFAIIAAIIILFLQFAALLIMLVSGQAFAQETAANFSFFATEKPEKDVAFLLLDHIFGVPDFFGSEAPTNTPFHKALHALFHFYNFAILIIAALIFVYYIIVVVVETAQSGTPFGQRFNTIYAPLRLVIALGLLVPLNYGLNGAQYITLYAAKVGSGFATNGWLRFNESINNPVGAEADALIGMPEPPKIDYLVNHMALVHTCRAGYKKLQGYDMGVYLIVDGVEHVIAEGDDNWMFVLDALNKNNGKDIKLTFGYKPTFQGPNPSGSAAGYSGSVIPYCGVMNIPVTSYDPQYGKTTPNNGTRGRGGGSGGASTGGSLTIGQQITHVHYKRLELLWKDAQLKEMAEKLVEKYMPKPEGEESDDWFDGALAEQIRQKHQSEFDGVMKINFNYYRNGVDTSIDEDVKDRGWGGAGIWYNRLAQWNGEVVAAFNALPSAAAYPIVTEHIVTTKRSTTDASYSGCDIFRPNLASGGIVSFENMPNNSTSDPQYARYMYHTQKAWTCDQETKITGNIFWDAMHMVFGIQGLFDMRCSSKNEDGRDSIHPLAQLTVVGKGLIDSSVRNMGAAMFTAAGGGALSSLGKFGGDLSAMGQAASGFFVSMATIGLSLGFLLFYILPFMPFLYFFFAVGAWVKGVFEAMCGAPLWALAHIKIDGDGLPGKSAMNGYFLIFEIFLRPILIVVGLISGMIIFSASVTILNEIFDTAVLRLTGIDLQTSTSCAGGAEQSGQDAALAIDDAGQLDKHILDEFFFTVMYAIFVYMIAMGCFKMIDLIPNDILRFMSAGVGVFADQVQDPTDNLAQYAAISGGLIGGKILGGVQQASQAGGQLVAAVPDMAQRFGNAANRGGGSTP